MTHKNTHKRKHHRKSSRKHHRKGSKMMGGNASEYAIGVFGNAGQQQESDGNLLKMDPAVALQQRGGNPVPATSTSIFTPLSLNLTGPTTAPLPMKGGRGLKQQQQQQQQQQQGGEVLNEIAVPAVLLALNQTIVPRRHNKNKFHSRKIRKYRR